MYFVAPFLKRLEERLGVHVVRVPELSTAYCFSIDGRDVIAIRATGNWFYENFCLAHELAHLAAGHLTGRAISDSEEVAANAFAAELLMPSDLVRKRGFNQITAEGLAQWVWEQGVSTDATARRTAALGILTSNVVSEWSTQTTQKLLRRHGYPAEPGRDEISDRMAAATTRHFPQELVRAHIARIEEGLIGPEVLAWMLDVDVAEIDLKAPQLPSSDVDKFAAELGLSPAQ